MPDMGIDYGKPDDNSLMADKPSLVVEVLSPTTGGFDVTIKLAEYQGLPSLDYILFVDTENPTIHLYRRDNGGLWQDEVLKGWMRWTSSRSRRFPCRLRNIYEGLEFRSKPKLVLTPGIPVRITDRVADRVDLPQAIRRLDRRRHGFREVAPRPQSWRGRDPGTHEVAGNRMERRPQGHCSDRRALSENETAPETAGGQAARRCMPAASASGHSGRCPRRRPIPYSQQRDRTRWRHRDVLCSATIGSRVGAQDPQCAISTICGGARGCTLPGMVVVADRLAAARRRGENYVSPTQI
jgi:hypothetical protein